MEPEETEEEWNEDEWPEDGTAGGLSRRLMDPEDRSKFGHKNQWRKNAEGRWVAPPLIDRFIEEYCLAPPRSRPSQKTWAERNGVAVRTIIGWKRDERFNQEWNRRLGMTYANPDRIRAIIDNMAETASQPGPQSVAAAKQYLEFLGMVTPPELRVKVEQVPSDLSSLNMAELVALTRELGEADE